MGDFVTCFKALWGLFFIFIANTAFAATATLSLDFDSADYDGGSILNIDGATIENTEGGDLFVYRTGDFTFPFPGGFCALDADEVCKANATITFDDPVSDLTFSSFFVSDGDAVLLRAVIGDESREFFITSEELIDLSDLDGITQISLFDVSGVSDKGIAFGAFSFTEYVPPPAIPLPAGFPLLLTALAFFGFGQFRSTARPRA